MLEHKKISWKISKIFTQERTNDCLKLYLSFYGKVEYALLAFIWEEFMDLVEAFGAKVYKYS